LQQVAANEFASYQKKRNAELLLHLNEKETKAWRRRYGLWILYLIVKGLFGSEKCLRYLVELLESVSNTTMKEMFQEESLGTDSHFVLV
jgi:hypothetical protein